MQIEKDGQQIEVFTQEELDAKLEEFKANNPDNEKFNELQTELEKTKTDLEALKKKDINFSNLRTQKEAAEDKIKELEKQMGELVTSVDSKIKTVEENRISEKVNEKINGLAAGDPELAKKIKFQFDRLKDPTNTEEELTKKITDAYILATKREDGSGSVIVNAIPTHSAPIVINRQKEGEMSPELKQVAEKMGITKEDIEKYGK